MARLRTQHYIMALIMLAVGSGLLWRDLERLASPYLSVHFFEIGQGDAILVETPRRLRILIDGGPGNALSQKLAEVLPFWDRSIDLVVLTHPQLDHLSGLLGVLERFEVKRVLLTGVRYRLDAYRAFLRKISQKGIPVHFARGGERLLLDQGTQALLVHPDVPLAGRDAGREINETSIVLRLDHGATSFLFTGDAGFPTERDLLADNDPIDADVLKVGHHGSRYSSSAEFLRAISPHIALIQAGRRNRYGHPTPETLERLAAVGALALRTDRDGSVEILSDGKHLARRSRRRCLIFC